MSKAVLSAALLIAFGITFMNVRLAIEHGAQINDIIGLLISGMSVAWSISAVPVYRSAMKLRRETKNQDIEQLQQEKAKLLADKGEKSCHDIS